MTDETTLTVYKEDETPTALTAWADNPTQAWQLADALMAMHPAAREIGIEGMRTVAQLALMTGANPLPGVNGIHVWHDPKSGKIVTQFGIGFWEGQARLAGGYTWLERPRPMTEAEKADWAVPKASTAFICAAALTKEVYAFLKEYHTNTGRPLPFREALAYVAKTGVGVAGPNEYAKSGRPPAWTAEQRALRDVLRKLVPIGSTATMAQPRYEDWSPDTYVRFANAGAREPDPDHEPYTVEQFNADLFPEPPANPAAGQREKHEQAGHEPPENSASRNDHPTGGGIVVESKSVSDDGDAGRSFMSGLVSEDRKDNNANVLEGAATTHHLITEQTESEILTTPANQFIPTAARSLALDEDQVKALLRDAGVDGIPTDAGKRLELFRSLAGSLTLRTTTT